MNVKECSSRMKMVSIILFRDLTKLNLENIVGFIMNIPTDLKLGMLHLPLHRKHWIAIRNIGGTYYNLDSKMDSPEEIGVETQLVLYLQEQIKSKEKELLVVLQPEMASEKIWKDYAPEKNGEAASDTHVGKNDVTDLSNGLCPQQTSHSNGTQKNVTTPGGQTS